MVEAIASCLWLFKQLIRCARALALDNAGSSMAAKMAMMAITTSNSIKVKPRPPPPGNARGGAPWGPASCLRKSNRLTSNYRLGRRNRYAKPPKPNSAQVPGSGIGLGPPYTMSLYCRPS